MIDVNIAPKCAELMGKLELPQDLAITVMNNRDRGMVMPGFTRIISAHWLDEDRIIYGEAVVVESEKEDSKIYFRKVEVNLVLELRPSLPSGQITRELKMDEIFEVVAESFGCPVLVHAKQPEPAKLISGPWDQGHRIKLNCPV